MNIFRLVADLLHLASICILLFKIVKTRNCAGVSLKTQELYLLVFVTRYFDLFTSFISVYNTVMKIFFLASAAAVVYYMRKPCRATYDASSDTFPVWTLCLFSLILALLFPDKYTLDEIVWTFSLFLEAVAILPQLYVLTSRGGAEALTSHYMFALGGYRALYLINWIYRYFFENYTPYNAWLAGIIQTALYADFLYMYVKKVLQGRKFELPG